MGPAAGAAAAAAATGPPSRIGLVLPAGWHEVPLRPDGARRRAVDALVARVVGDADDAALLRARLRTGLAASADEAAERGAQLLALSLMRSRGGLPLPASLVVTVVDAGSAAGAAAALPTTAGVRATRLGAGWAARRVQERHDPAVDQAPVVLAVDYWLRRDGDPLVAVLSFSTPLVALRDAVLPLFDAVVHSARWQDG